MKHHGNDDVVGEKKKSIASISWPRMLGGVVRKTITWGKRGISTFCMNFLANVTHN